MTDTTNLPAYVQMGVGGPVISGSKKILNENGVAYVFTELKGWDEPPALVTEAKQRTGNHGKTAGQSWQGERNLEIPGFVIVPGDDRTQLRDAVDDLFAAIPLEDDRLIVQENGLTRHLYVRQGGQPTGDRIGRKSGRFRVAAFSIQLVALDPIRLSGDGSGFTEHHETEPGVDGAAVTVPIGKGLVPPILLSVSGPCTRPAIAIQGKPEVLAYDLDIPDGAELHINLDTKSATLDGAPVNGLRKGQWLKPERRSNTFTITADAYGPSAQLAVDTYLSSP